MTTLIASDMHLDQSRPQMVRAFEQFLAGPAREADSLLILGDLFEVWIGDDDDSELGLRVAQALRAVANHGVAISFQHGNRDFLLGPTYADTCAMTLLPEEHVACIEGTDTLLVHGDSLCLHDLAYARYRAQVRDVQWQRAFLSQPLAARREYAAAARKTSAQHTASASPVLTDVDPLGVENSLARHAVRRMIHGHTHRPAIHSTVTGANFTERVVLPDWYSLPAWLRVTPNGMQVEGF